MGFSYGFGHDANGNGLRGRNQRRKNPCASFFQLKRRVFFQMETVQTNAAVAALITVNGPAFAKWRKAVDAANAAKKEVDALKEVCGFPDTENLVSMLGLAQGGKASATVADGNGKPIGKVSVYWKGAFEIPAGFSSRVS